MFSRFQRAQDEILQRYSLRETLRCKARNCHDGAGFLSRDRMRHLLRVRAGTNRRNRGEISFVNSRFHTQEASQERLRNLGTGDNGRDSVRKVPFTTELMTIFRDRILQRTSGGLLAERCYLAVTFERMLEVSEEILYHGSINRWSVRVLLRRLLVLSLAFSRV